MPKVPRVSIASRLLLVVLPVGALSLGAQTAPRSTPRPRATPPAPVRNVADPLTMFVPESFFAGMRYRMVGPARGGRVTTVTGVPQEPLTFYMGSTGGGVWKTTDAGQTWVNISDGFFDVGSMGDIDVSNSDPNVIYAGTGSDGLRSNVSIGRGVYRSVDAGRTWLHVGLTNVGNIGGV